MGRYILTPKIFEMIEKTPTGKGGEIQLTDAILALKEIEPVYSSVFEGVRYDAGSKLGYLKATVDFALKHPEVQQQFREFIDKIDLS